MKVKLRAMEPEDLDLLYKIENDRELWGVGMTNVPYSRYVLHDYIAHSSGDIYADKQVRLMVENEAGDVVGLVDIVNFDARNCRAEIGVVIERSHRRRGYAGEALRQVAQYASQILHLHQLYAYVDTANDASLRLFEKMGYDRSFPLRHWLYDGHDYHDAVLMQTFF